jgi:hypothetical protein
MLSHDKDFFLVENVNFIASFYFFRFVIDLAAIRKILENEAGGVCCPSCKMPFDKGKKRKLIDTCGHAKCYSCMFKNESCTICANTQRHHIQEMHHDDTNGKIFLFHSFSSHLRHYLRWKFPFILMLQFMNLTLICISLKIIYAIIICTENNLHATTLRRMVFRTCELLLLLSFKLITSFIAMNYNCLVNHNC